MAAMFRRPRPGGGRHPPPLAPTVSSFKPRAQWTYSESSIFLYVNLPGFYRDQIKIKMDVTTRMIQIQGERPLSTQTKARFNETYIAPERCDLTKMNTSFSHGLLTIEFPFVVEAEKPEKIVQDRRTTAQRRNQEESRGPGLNASNLGRKKPSDEGTQAAPKLKEEEPKTYKSVLEDKRADPKGIREKFEKKVKEGEASTSLGGKERAKEEQAARSGQEQTVRKLKEEETRSGLKPKVHAKEEKVTEVKKKDADIGKIGQKVKEEGIAKTSTTGDILENKVQAKVEKVVERKGSQKLKEEVNTKVGEKKQEKSTAPFDGGEARRTEKNIAATNRAEAELKTKEIVERVAQDVNGNVKSKQVGDKVSEGEIQETMKGRKIEEAGLAKETGDVKDNREVAETKKVVSDDPKKEEATQGGEDRVEMVEKSLESETGLSEAGNLAKETRVVKDNLEEKVVSDDAMKEEPTQGGEDRGKMVEKSLESETGLLLAEEGQNKTDKDSTAVRGTGQESGSLVNVGVAALVIMGFGAFAFVPIVKLFY